MVPDDERVWREVAASAPGGRDGNTRHTGGERLPAGTDQREKRKTSGWHPPPGTEGQGRVQHALRRAPGCKGQETRADIGTGDAIGPGNAGPAAHSEWR